MPSKTTYADLTLYDSVLDEGQYFKDFRVDIAGVGTKTTNSDTRSNFQKIDDILSEHIPNDSIHRKVYDISAFKNSETETSETYLASNIQNFDILASEMLFILSVNIANSKNMVYLSIRDVDNTALIQKFNSSGQRVDLEIGDLIPNNKYILEYDYYNGVFVLISYTTAKEILDKLKTVDGADSGLDADLLDGKQGSEYATSAQGAKADSAIQSIKGNGTTIQPDQNQAVDITPSNIGAVPIIRTINSKALSSDINLAYSDIGVVPFANGGTGATSQSQALANLGLESEEGTWTPILASSGPNQPTYTPDYYSGVYRRLGNLCYIAFHGKWYLHTVGNDDQDYACVAGLPFYAMANIAHQALSLTEAGYETITREDTLVGTIKSGEDIIHLSYKDGTTACKFRLSATEPSRIWLGFHGMYLINEARIQNNN